MIDIKHFCILLLLYASSSAISAQASIGPAELWPGRLSAYPSYQYIEAANTVSFDQSKKAVSVLYWQPEGTGEALQTVKRLPGLSTSKARLWSFAADGQAQSFTEVGEKAIRYIYRYNPAGQLTTLAAEDESRVYDYDHQPDTEPLQRLAAELPHWPQWETPKDTILVNQQKTGDRHWLLINKHGWLSAYIHQSGRGTLKAHRLYRHQVDESGEWESRVEWNVLTDELQRTQRKTLRKADPKVPMEKMATGQWYGLCKYGTRLYLHANGHLLRQEQAVGPFVGGEWERSGGELQLKLKNRRQTLVFEEQSKLGAVWLQGEGDKLLPMLPLEETTGELRRAAAGLEAFSWESITQNGRVGLEHRLDGRRLPAKYDAVEAVASGYAIVTLEGLQGLVRYDGQALTPIYYESLEPLAPDMLLAKREGGYGLIRPNGVPIIEPRYSRLYHEPGELRVFRNAKMGVVDTSGQVLIPLEFDSLSNPFGPSLRKAWIGHQMGVVDAEGEWLLPAGPYEQLGYIDSTTFLVQHQSGLWAIWQAGQGFVTDPVYPYLQPLGPSILLVQQNGQFGLLRTDGSKLTPLQYQLIKGCTHQSTGDLCELLVEHNAVAQFISNEGFGYLDGYGREHAPRLPSTERIADEYETVRANDHLKLTFPKGKWRWEASANRLYKQGDYGRVRVFYELLDTGGEAPAAWLQANQPELYPKLQQQSLGGQEAWVALEIERIRYYDFRKKYAFIPLSNGQVLRLEFSCKVANYLENAQDLYEIEQLLKVNP